ncbi:GntR family transcriptional regulator [Bradyrhizobium sp. 14AA]
MDSEALAPLRHEPAPLRNQIIVALRGAIESGNLQPGQRLVDRELCARLGVSRTSLREALRELQAIGVFASDNRGLSVAVLTPDEANNIYAIRGVIEALVAGQFTEKATDEEVAALAGLADNLKAAYATGSVQDIIRSKRALYDQMCHGARNTIALDIIDRLTLRTSSLRSQSLSRPQRQKQSIAEIDAIVTAIKARDQSAAAAAAAAHVAHAANSALDKTALSSLATPEQTRAVAARRTKGMQSA